MNFLVFTAVQNSLPFATGSRLTSECTFSVSIDGAPFVPAGSIAVLGLAGVTFPPGAQTIEILAIPASPDFWPLTGRFDIQPSGHLLPVQAPAEFAPTRLVNIGIGSITVLEVFLSRLRDSTETALASLAAVPDVRTTFVPSPWPPADWESPPLTSINCIDEQPISPSGFSPIHTGGIAIAQRSLDPKTTDLVVELKNVRAPQTLAISWPDSIPRTATAGPTPFLVYFHSAAGQNAPLFYTNPAVPGDYPFNFDYVFFGLWRYMNYQGDPLAADPYCKGLPYQMQVTAKDAVIVLPCNRVGAEVGILLKAASMEAVLNEIQGFMFRRRGIYTTPGLGRVALGAFSAGNMFIRQFLLDPANRKHPFCLETLREVYLFGSAKHPAGPNIVDCVNAAIAWSKTGTTADKMIRVYLESLPPNFPTFVKPLPAPPFVVTSGNNTVSVLNAAAWNAAATGAGNPLMSTNNPPHGTFQDTHQLVSAMMLVDALAHSGF